MSEQPRGSAAKSAGKVEAGAVQGDATTDSRAALRRQLLQLRDGLVDRAERERVLINRVARWLQTMPVTRLAFYWPVRGEPDLRGVIGAWLDEDPERAAGLPVIDGEILLFARWWPDAPMRDGTYGIPVPSGASGVKPQLLILPCVGIDRQRYRLGYGGGYYDRTLARLAVRPVTVGVGFDCARVSTITPQPHDIRLDLAITESGVL